MLNEIHYGIGSNARSYTLTGICNTFIPNEYYEKLTNCEHSIIIGPRGSGKTTLLKMLQPEALALWNNDISKRYTRNIEFTGVFISTDKMWKTQYDDINKNGTPAQINTCNRIFELHIVEKIINSAYYVSRPDNKEKFRYLNLSSDSESELVVEISSQIGIKPKILTLRSLSASISLEKSRLSIDLKNSRIKIESSPIVSITNTIGTLINSINLYSGYHDYKWCLLFDELELAPEEFIQPLIDSMRGGPDNVIFKLAMSPYHRNIFTTKTTVSAMRNEDFTLMNLSVSNTNALNFSRELMSKALGLPDVSSLDGIFEDALDEKTYSLFSRLACKDASFAKYLSDRKISTDEITFNSYTENDMLPLIRKIKFIARIRDAYLSNKGRRRSVKRSFDFYSGIDNLLKAIEHNPRMIIGMANQFKNHIQEKGKVPIHVQLKVLDDFFESFKSLLSTIKFTSSDTKIKTAFDLIDIIAKNFREQIVGHEFNAEPKGSIIFSKFSLYEYSEAIGCCLNAGALIAEEPNDDLIDIVKARCRLSYIFSSKYFLLMTLQREVDLHEVTKGIRNIKVHQAYDTVGQLTLI